MKFIDLFSGIGGFRIALEKFGLQCVFSSDNNKLASQVYYDNFGVHPYGDIKKVSVDEIPAFNILTAGFPCQPFSYSGKKEGFKDKIRGTLFFDIVRILKYHQPEMFLLENVKGITSHDGGNTIKIINEALDELGYTYYQKVINSHDFGVPQNRERWYCVGFKEPTPFTFPYKTNNKTTLKDIIDYDNNDPSLRLTDFELNRIKHHFQSNDKRVKHDNSKYDPWTKKGKYGVYSFQKPDGSLRFHIGDPRKTQIQEAFYSSLDSVASAIIATREPKLWEIERRISVLEAKRLQGFPDNFNFDSVSDRMAKRLLGNSVTVPVIEKIIGNMLYYYNNK